MFGTIRKHQTWLWGVLIAAVIVSFVIFFTPGSGRGGGIAMAKTYGTMNGRPIPRADYLQADLESKLSFFVRFGSFPSETDARRTGFNEKREARSRLVLLKQLEALGIEVDDQSVADWIQRNFSSPDQPGSAKANYLQLLDRLARRKVSEEEFTNFIRHEIGISQMVNVVGTAGLLVTPRSAARDYRLQNERVEAEAVLLMSSNYLAKVKITPAALGQFYTNRQSAYRTPERVSVFYLRFPASNYVEQAELKLSQNTNLTAQLDALYQQRGANAFLDTNGQVMPPEAAKLKLREELRDAEALKVARREAAKFGSELLEMEPLKAENLVNLASAKQLVVGSTPPFTESRRAVLPGASQRLAQIAFKLTPENPIANPLVGTRIVDIIALKERLPSRVPAFEEVQARVTADFRREEARKLTSAAGTELASRLKEAVAAGGDFTQAAIQAGYPPLTLPRFSAATRNLPSWPPAIPISRVQQLVQNLKDGEVSSFIPGPGGGFILHVRAREAVGDQELKDALPGALADAQKAGRFPAFRDWLNRQVELSNLRFPDDPTEQSEPAAPSGTEN